MLVLQVMRVVKDVSVNVDIIEYVFIFWYFIVWYGAPNGVFVLFSIPAH